MYLKILNDDFDSGVNTSVGSGVVVYGRHTPFSNLAEYEKEREYKKAQKNAGKKAPKKHRDKSSRRTYD